MLTIGSLFSGIGGLELGLEWAGLGPVVWQVERERFCQCVLRHHWPTAELHDDVCKVGRSNLAPVDLICGGFPCQDVSPAGTRKGLAGSRSGLWSEYRRIVSELRPSWLVVENVAGGAAQWLDAVICELDALGYDCLPCPVSAADVGAPHRRERIFVVAHANDRRKLQPSGSEPDERGRSEDETGKATPDALGICGTQGREHLRPRQPYSQGDAPLAPNSDDARREGPGPGEQAQGRQGSTWNAGWSLESGMVPLVHGLSGGMAGRRRRARIRALGNTVVPQCAEVVGWVIRELAAADRRVA